MIILAMNVYRPDSPIATIPPGSSDEPSFVVQVIRPRSGLPLGGVLPPQLFGVDAELGFNSKTVDAKYTLTGDTLKLSGANWELTLVYDARGQIQPQSKVVFDLIFEDQERRVRCKPGNSPAGTLERIEVEPDGYSGNFSIQLPVCEDDETGQSLGWPPNPFMLRGSFDRLPITEGLDGHISPGSNIH